MSDKTEKDTATDQKTLGQQLDDAMAMWEAKIDEARVQMNLGSKDAMDAMQPHIDQLEEGLNKAKDQWQDFANSSEGAWDEIQSGMSDSMKSMQQAISKATKNFTGKKD